MCQCRFFICNKCTTLVGDFDSGGGCVGVGAEDIWKITVSSAQLFYEPKNALQNSLFKKCCHSPKKKNQHKLKESRRNKYLFSTY